MKNAGKTWGLALSGGAAWGIANGGVMHVLRKENLLPDAIAGSSMGAIVGALVCMNVEMEKIETLLEHLSLTNIVRPTEKLPKKGLHDGFLRQQLDHHLFPILGNACIGDCTIPFVCIAGKVKQTLRWHTILREGFTEHALECIELTIFGDNVRLIDALLATSAIPVLFSPAIIDGIEYIDLCTFGAIPARTLKEKMHPDLIVATDTTPSYGAIRKILPQSWKDFLDAGHKEAERSKAICDLLIEPTFSKGAHRFDKAQEFYDAGKKAAENILTDLHKLLS